MNLRKALCTGVALLNCLSACGGSDTVTPPVEPASNLSVLLDPDSLVVERKDTASVIMTLSGYDFEGGVSEANVYLRAQDQLPDYLTVLGLPLDSVCLSEFTCDGLHELALVVSMDAPLDTMTLTVYVTSWSHWGFTDGAQVFLSIEELGGID